VKKLTADIMDHIHGTTAEQILRVKRELLERLLDIEIRIRKLENPAYWPPPPRLAWRARPPPHPPPAAPSAGAAEIRQAA